MTARAEAYAIIEEVDAAITYWRTRGVTADMIAQQFGIKPHSSWGAIRDRMVVMAMLDDMGRRGKQAGAQVVGAEDDAVTRDPRAGHRRFPFEHLTLAEIAEYDRLTETWAAAGFGSRSIPSMARRERGRGRSS